MIEQKEKYRQFKKWQHQPHQVAPLSEEMHECATCGTHFEGNYCPRCGQSAQIGRYSFKKALLLFLDVWGVGNRGMFRSIRDLLLRPGYMINDYLREWQQKKNEFLNKLYSGEIFKKGYSWINKNIALVYLACLLLFSVPLFLMFRHSPATPDLRFSECFVAMIYVTGALSGESSWPSFPSPSYSSCLSSP